MAQGSVRRDALLPARWLQDVNVHVMDELERELPAHRLLPPPMSPSSHDSPELTAAGYLPQMVLALDASQAANVAYFVRHVPVPSKPRAKGGGGPNLVMQPVLMEGARSTLLYRVALFAARHVEALEELTCDFRGMV